MKEEKKNVHLTGTLLYPITVGRGAVVFSGGQVIHTSRVVAVHEQTIKQISFETLHTHYTLTLGPFPLAGMNPLALETAA
ncbi:hypothetical protein ACRQU7_01360 [Caproiciproducens sp. R1]|uniref:hypothetical protein n=1 Tax=Acutalibacteraceae TaxID=3082771 RepID=UPI002E13010C